MTHKPRFSLAARLAALAAGTGLMAATILPAGRSLTGDAPALLGRARRMQQALAGGDVLGALGAGLGQVVPQPPLGYAMAASAWVLGLQRAAPIAISLAALAMIGAGMSLAARDERSPLGLAPLAAGLMLLASPMTWAAAEHVQWDLLCAGWVSLSLGALIRSDGLKDRRWVLAAGALAGGASLVKYNAPFFLWLPLLAEAVRASREGRRASVGWLVAAGAAPLLLWTPFAAAELVPYLQSSASGGDSASDVPGLFERLQPGTLAYYPAVMKDALGWPGVLLCLGALGAWKARSGRLLWLALLGGGLCLALVGRREPRYLFPLLPLALLAAEIGWGRLPRRGARMAVGAAVLLIAGVQLFSTVNAYRRWPDPRPLAQLAFGPENLLRWGAWPAPEPAFVPTSSLATTWKVAAATDAIVAASEGPTICTLLYANPRVPPADLFVLEAAARGLVWDRIELEILSAHHTGPPPPEVPLGRVPGAGGPDPDAPRRPAQPPPRPPEDETFIIRAVAGPVPALVGARECGLLYAIHPRGEPFYRAFFSQLGAEPIERLPLPRGFEGVLWRLGEPTGEGALGAQLREAITGSG